MDLKYVFILFITVLFYQDGLAQLNGQNEINFHHLSINEGLSQSAVNCILQDSKGMMWFGTMDGLNRFDGYTFKKYKSNLNDSTSVSSSIISCLLEENDGKIWVGTFGGGISIFDPLTDKFTSFKSNPQDSTSLSSNEITAIVHCEKSLYWVSTFLNGLNLFDTVTKKSIRITKTNDMFPLSSNNIRGMVKGDDGRLYIATRGGLNILDYKKKIIKKFEFNPTDTTGIQDNKLQSISKDHKGRLWIGSRNAGAFMFDPATEKFTQYKHDDSNPNSIASNYVNCVQEVWDGIIWIGTFANGLSILNPVNDSIYHFTHNDDDPLSLSSNQVLSIYGGNQNIIWVGTNAGGISYSHKSFTQFTSLKNMWGDIRTPDHKNIFSICKDDDKLWIGTGGAGLFCYNTSEKLMTNLINSAENENTISYNHIWSLAKINNDSLVIGTYGKGLNIMNLNLEKITRYKNDSSNINSLSSDQILCMKQANDSQIWIGTNAAGISIFNFRSSVFQHLKNDPDNAKSLGGNFVLSIFKSRDGSFFIGHNEKGLDVSGSNSNSFTHYRNDPTNYFSISNNSVYCIYEDVNGIIWMGTIGGGLNAFDRQTKHFIHYTEQDGLPNNVIYGICGDKMGNLWMSTNNGICKFTPPKQIDFNTINSSKNKPAQIRNFNSGDGLSSNEFNQGAYYQSPDGWIYFGSIAGLTCFHPASISDNTFNPPVVLTNFKVFENNYRLDTVIEYKKCITLNYDQDFFSFEFAALNYLMPEKNQYAFMMQGFDKKWNYTGNRRYVNFTNLKPGTYTFKVKASNNDGVWNENYTSIQVIITPPFWETWWFRILMIIAFATAVYILFMSRVKAIRKEEKQKTEFNTALAEVEMKALRAQMNPHFIFNSLNSINNYITSKDEDSASDYLGRFSRLIRLILENSMHKTIALDKDLEALELYMQMEQLRFENGFDYKVEKDDNVESDSILIPPLLLQPFVENAIWHGLKGKDSKGKILIKIETSADTLKCIVEDNGIGREKARELESKNKTGHQSLGMKVTRERIELLKQQKDIHAKVEIIDLKDANGIGIGTRVEILIPLAYNY